MVYTSEDVLEGLYLNTITCTTLPSCHRLAGVLLLSTSGVPGGVCSRTLYEIIGFSVKISVFILMERRPISSLKIMYVMFRITRSIMVVITYSRIMYY